MIPPTSIDGTDITGATIDGTDVQEITVDGDTVFTAGPTKIIDDFETNLNVWSGATGRFSIDSGDSKVGSSSLLNVSADNDIISTTTGKTGVPETGDLHQLWFKEGNTSNTSVAIHYSFDDNRNTYRVVLEPFTQELRFDAIDGGTLTITKEVSCNWNGNWRLVKMFHDTNGDFTHTVEDENGNTLANLTGNNTTHISGGSFDAAACAIQPFLNEPDRVDHWIVP